MTAILCLVFAQNGYAFASTRLATQGPAVGTWLVTGLTLGAVIGE